MARPKKKNKKKSLSITINKKLDDIVNELIEEKKLSKSEYIEYLLKKDKLKNNK